jgi:hypothetical protein
MVDLAMMGRSTGGVPATGALGRCEIPQRMPVPNSRLDLRPGGKEKSRWETNGFFDFWRSGRDSNPRPPA